MAKKQIRKSSQSVRRTKRTRTTPLSLAEGVAERQQAYPSLGWYFAKNEGGEERGLNDSGIETFKTNPYACLAREIIQNSLDARATPLTDRDDPRMSRISDNNPVEVTFNLESLDVDELPQFSAISDVFKACSQYWPNDETRAFCTQATQLLDHGTLDLLRISDFNTTGVRGSDKDRTHHRGWHSLVRSSGSSAKSEQQGGSFGIGKSAPFAMSALRTVFYSTRTTEGTVSFVGVSRLMAYEDRRGSLRQSVGYYGVDKGASVVGARSIPRRFLRKTVGTDVCVLGFKGRGRWKKEIRKAVIEHFWPALASGELVVKLSDEIISKERLPELMELESPGTIGYLECLTSPETRHFTRELPSIGKVHLFLLTGENYPCRVAMIRNTGMVIYHHPVDSWVRYSGVFVCENAEGSGILRKMEPPRHNKWETNRPKLGYGKQTLNEIKAFLNECVKSLASVETGSVDTLREIAQFLPDDEPNEDLGTMAPAPADERKLESFPTPVATRNDVTRLAVSVVPKKTPVPRISGTFPDQGGAEKRDSATAGGTHGVPPGEASDRPSMRGAPISIRYRAFPIDSAAKTFRVVVHPESMFSGNMTVFLTAIGDDVKEALRIESAKTAGGVSVSFNSSGSVGPIKVTGGKVVSIEVQLEKPGRRAVEVSACED